MHPDLDRLPFTRRGWTVIGIVLSAVVLGALFGPRSLNAVAAPAALALAVALWRVTRLELPDLRRSVPAVGTAGESHDVRLAFTGTVDRLGRIEDHLSDGLSAEGHERERALDAGLSYTIHLDRRGRRTLGPVTITARDLLGLVERSWRVDETSQILVYPKVHRVPPGGLSRLGEVANLALLRERHEFDRLREYQPQDSLRDIHWKTSAKRPDTEFIVQEFVNERDRGTVILSGSAEVGADDALAEALASLAAALLRAGVNVGVLTERGRVAPITEPDRFDRLLAHLALVGPGLPELAGDVHLVAESADVTSVRIESGAEDLRFGELLAADDRRPMADPMAATSTEVAD